MKPQLKHRLATEEWRDSPTAWFAVLERAMRDGDADLVRSATAELDRLGVRVTIAHAEAAHA